MVGRTAQGAGLGQEPRGIGEVLDRRDLPGEVVQPDRAARGARRLRPDREQAEVVVVVATARAHEDGLAAELAGDDLEAEDAAVELGGPGGVADEQDGVVEAGDRDAHGDSVRHRTRPSPVMPRPAGPAGAPTSFQPDCQLRRWRC